MTQPLILSIDCGTQSIRASLVDSRGNFIALEKIPITPYFSKNPGWAEQEAEVFWKTLCSATKRLLAQKPTLKKYIQGVTVTTQRSTLVNLDKNGKPLRPAMIWLDRRKAHLEKWPPLWLKILLQAINFLGAAQYAYTECEANWLRQEQPEIWDKTHKFLFLSGYLNYMLSGEFIDSTASIVGYVPFNYKTHTWAKKNDLKWKMFPMAKSILPQLAPPSAIIGQISRKAARDTGIPAGLPLVASGGDKATEILGAGCTNPETACLSFGTTATINTTTDTYVEMIPYFPPYPSAIPGFYNTEIMVYRGFWLLSWFKEEFAHLEKEIARKKNISVEEIFDQRIMEIPPGSSGLMLQPFWSPGVKVPGPEARGSIIGFRDHHGRAAIYRAIIEGLVYALKEGAQRTEKRTKHKIQSLIISGGGSQSHAAMQIAADVFNLPAQRPKTFETSSLGGAINGMVGLGVHADFKIAIREMTGIGEIFEPKQENVKIYKELYNRGYLKMYKKLKPIYRNFEKILFK